MKIAGKELVLHHTYFASFIYNLLQYPLLAQHPLLVKYTKIMGCTSVQSISDSRQVDLPALPVQYLLQGEG